MQDTAITLAHVAADVALETAASGTFAQAPHREAYAYIGPSSLSPMPASRKNHNDGTPEQEFQHRQAPPYLPPSLGGPPRQEVARDPPQQEVPMTDET